MIASPMTTLRLSLTAAVLLAPAAALARPMTPEDVARLVSVSDVAISQDGSRIAYTRARLPDVTKGEENGPATRQLFLADGADAARAFLPDDVDVRSIRFSPDGTMIGYLWAKGSEDRAVWAIPVNGGAPRKLAGVRDADLRAFAWAPDGASLTMLVSAAPDAQRDDEEAAGFDSVVYEEEPHFNRLFVADLSQSAGNPNAGSGEIDPQIDRRPREIMLPGYVDQFQIAPDGSWALVTSAPSPLVDDSYTVRRAVILDLASGEIRHVIATPGKLGDIEISPDGAQLSMIAAVDENDPAPTTLHLVDVTSGEYRALNAGAPEAAVDTEWMADGRLAVAVHVGAQSRLRFYTARGDMEREIDPGALIVTGLAQGGNRLAALAHAPEHPAELFLLERNDLTRWTHHNTWLADVDFGAQRTVTFTARDGQQVEGVLIEPVGGVPAGGAPTIMNVHGGPESHDSNGWMTSYSDVGQVGAGAGYAVFYPNYRGSTAYGTAFSKAHTGRYTEPEFTDIVDAKRALVEMGITDADRTGITGGSYGGYATAWSSTALSEEYAAGVMFVGIANQISKFGTGDIPNEMYLVHSNAWPWDDWQAMLEVSPVYHAGKADTPLLIMHGDSDPRVDPGQSLEMYRSIKIRRPDTPLRLVFYPGEGHGNRMAAARYDYSLRMMEWFDTYLKSGDRDAPLPAPRPQLPESVLGEVDETAE